MMSHCLLFYFHMRMSIQAFPSNTCQSKVIAFNLCIKAQTDKEPRRRNDMDEKFSLSLSRALSLSYLLLLKTHHVYN